MPWKLIGFLILVGLILAFVGFNAQNVSDVSFGFYRFEEVPIFVSLFIAFFLGVLVTIPLTFRRRSTRASKRPKKEGRGTGGSDEEEELQKLDQPETERST